MYAAYKNDEILTISQDSGHYSRNINSCEGNFSSQEIYLH